MRCALVPLAPKADTPARRGRSGRAGHGRASVSSRMVSPDQSTSGVGASACKVAGSAWCRNASTILITPATPAAAWVWPTLLFTDPSHSGSAVSRLP